MGRAEKIVQRAEANVWQAQGPEFDPGNHMLLRSSNIELSIPRSGPRHSVHFLGVLSPILTVYYKSFYFN